MTLINFFISYVLAMGIALALMAGIRQFFLDKKYEVIPALVCFVVFIVRWGLLWAASRGGAISLSELREKQPVVYVFGSNVFVVLLLSLTLLCCLYWVKHKWFVAISEKIKQRLPKLNKTTE